MRILLENDKWTHVRFAKQFLEHAGNLGALAMSHMFMGCQYMPKDDFVWFAVECHSKSKKLEFPLVGYG